MSHRNYIQIAMMKRYGKTQTVFQDRRQKRSGEKIDWMIEFQDTPDDHECDLDIADEQ